jgi:drug/metabolite transporter (DMT)-like permease
MSRKGLLLFLAAGVAWGIPYFFIRLSVDYFSPATIIVARVLIGAAVLLPMAIHQKALKPALKAWPWVLSFALLEMVGPWWLVTSAEKHITSGLTGLLIATVPFFATVIAYFFLGDKSVRHPKTIFGLVIGFIGVFLLVGIDSLSGQTDPVWVWAVVLASVLYAVAPAMASVKLAHVPAVGQLPLSMLMVAVMYLPAAVSNFGSEVAANPPASAWISLVTLGVVCSAIAFVIFFALIREIGSARATLITYLNTVVALILGVSFLSEPITVGMMVGIPLVIVGSYFATKRHA